MNYRDLSLPVLEALVRSNTGPKAPGAPGAVAGRAPAPPPFTIAISREAGAGGRSVAAEVGRRLGWRVYDREILEKIAGEMQRPAHHLEAVDERPYSWLEDCLSGLLNESHIPSDKYMKYLLGTVRGLGAMGRCVIVGRGANFILPAETTLRVRLVASREDRVQTMSGRLGLSAREAAAWVETTERQRAEFVVRYFRQDTADPHHYDLVLNTSRIPVGEVADFIVQTLRRFEARVAPAPQRQEAPVG